MANPVPSCSGALAALLKELSKTGLGKRAVEIFDWLRTLEEQHDLAHLCDVYTYTTMISQCGSHQQLRRALELVAEMRSRGVLCNVHTYSALMNVCIKANELDLALDVYRQLLHEGFSPNLVTYNTLISAGSAGAPGTWQSSQACFVSVSTHTRCMRLHGALKAWQSYSYATQ